MVPCQPVPSRSRLASWACSASSQPSGRVSSTRTAHGAGDLVGEVLGREPPGHVGHVDPPAVQALAQPVGHDRVRAVVQPPGQLGRPVVELGQVRVAEPGRVAVAVEEVELALEVALVGPRQREPVVAGAGVVGGQVADDPEAGAVGGAAAAPRARRRRRAAGRRGRRRRRRSGGWSGPRRPASGRAASRRGRSGGRAARGPRRACRRRAGCSSSARGGPPGRPSRPACAQSGAGSPVAVRSNRSGNTW